MFCILFHLNLISTDLHDSYNIVLDNFNQLGDRCEDLLSKLLQTLMSLSITQKSRI